MKARFTVNNNISLLKKHNAILVNNYDLTNEVSNISVNYERVQQYKYQHSVGVWKIKNLNK